jgi:hypothetical protein
MVDPKSAANRLQTHDNSDRFYQIMSTAYKTRLSFYGCNVSSVLSEDVTHIVTNEFNHRRIQKLQVPLRSVHMMMHLNFLSQDLIRALRMKSGNVYEKRLVKYSWINYCCKQKRICEPLREHIIAPIRSDDRI